MAVDEGLLRTWVTGWAITRSVAPPVVEGGGWRVEVGLPDQKRRHVFADAVEGIRGVAAGVDEPWVLIKACAPPEAVRPLLPPRFSVTRSGFMMTRERAGGQSRAAPEGYRLSVEADGPALMARMLTSGGGEAARGRLAFEGERAIYDRIATEPEHQRRGLGTAVMRALERLAVERGYPDGVLVATDQGRALYETLGWRVASPYTTGWIEPGP